MKRPTKNFWQNLKNPPVWAFFTTYFSTLTFAIGALCAVFLGWLEKGALAILSYVLFAFAAISLSYAVYLTVRLAPKLKRAIMAMLCRRAFTRRLISDFGFRTVMFAGLSFFVNVLFSAFNAYMGIRYKSIWYGALAAYYLCLSLLRGATVFFGSRKNRGLQWYTATGGILLVTTLALSAAVAQMVFGSGTFSYAGWTIYAVAAYAFYKIVMAILNVVRSSKHDWSVQAIRNVGLADASVSILALQTALLTTFGEGVAAAKPFNAVTGSLVCVLVVTLGVWMLVKGIKNIRMEKNNAEK